MKIRIITDGNNIYRAPKGMRLPAGNFEVGPMDKEGIRHVHGIYHAEYRYEMPEHLFSIPEMPKSWL